MKARLTLVAGCAALALLAGCVHPMRGNVLSAITLEHIASDGHVDNSVNPLKRGESKTMGVLMFSTGDGSIGTAMRNGGLTRVNRVDYHVTNFLFLYSEILTVVYGE